MFKSTGIFTKTHFFSRLGLRKMFITTLVGGCILLPDTLFCKEEKTIKSPQDSTSLLLSEITVWSGIKNRNLSPLRLRTIDQQTITSLATGKTYPEVLSLIPGIYSTSETGSYGDAKINIRGFKQENISVLLNGTPISGLTSGNMFWNNWLGLSDATASIQVQKGIGGSMLADNSVGGTINIITKSPIAAQQLNLGYYYTNSGLSKGFAEYNSGALKNGWGFSLMASYAGGSSWIESSNVNSWAYMATISKKINNKHSLLFTALGSPEKHQQRSARITYSELEQYGAAYSKNWGYYNNTKKTISQNNYFKPYFTLNHQYKTFVGKNKDKLFSLSSAVYFTVGNGGGYWTESKGKRLISYQKDGHIDWDRIVLENESIAQDASKTGAEGSARNIMSDYNAGHTQIGVKSSFSLDISRAINLEGGIHYQHYRTWENEQITDLLGANYWWEDYAKNSIAGVAGRNPVKKVGDYIRTDNGKNTNYSTVYGMATFSPRKDAPKDMGRWIINIGASANAMAMQRWDKYNYNADSQNGIFSETASGFGAAVKGGALYKFGISPSSYLAHSLYLNAAVYSRIPYANVYFANGNNHISQDITNEKNYLAELGYRLVFPRGGIELNLYYAYWKNKSIMSDPYKPIEEDSYRFMITGLDARHYGLEIDAYTNFTSWLKLEGYLSLGNWKWKNNVHATIYDQYTGKPSSTINVFSDNLPVGDSPQTQIGAQLQIEPLRAFNANTILKNSNFNINISWQYNARYWADFDPISRTNAQDLAMPYKIPSYNLVNLAFNWSQKLGFSIFNNKQQSSNINFFFNLNNVFDTLYIERGKDGSTHSKEDFSGYWAQGRNFNFGIRMGF